MTEIFVYGTLREGSRNHNWMEKIGARYLEEGILEGGYRMCVRYKGNRDDRFDRTNPSHYVEPILIRDHLSKERICGSIFEIDDLNSAQGLIQVMGIARHTPLIQGKTKNPDRTIYTHIRAQDSRDLVYRNDPCLFQFDDNRVAFYDAHLYVAEYDEHPIKTAVRRINHGRTSILNGHLREGTLFEIAPEELFRMDIDSGTWARRVSVQVTPPGTNQQVPAHVYVERSWE